MPTGTNSAKFVATSSEINLIDNLLEKESVTRDYLTALLQQKQDHFKSDVIGHQVEVIPVVFVYLSVLIVSSLNIIFTLVGGWTLIRQGKYSKET